LRRVVKKTIRDTLSKDAEESMYRNWRDLIKPRGVEVDKETRKGTYGKFVCEPLERGYGYTLGNALRRVLLSSLQGTAVTAVRIEGALHEFTTLPDVKEDVTEIVLNVKEVLLKSSAVEPRALRVNKSGPGPVTVGDFTGDGTVEILNKKHVIATLGEGGRLEMELRIENGKGYRRASLRNDPEMPIGSILVDALFSPIKRVNYTVTNARVGQQTDYDKLTLEITTDGSVTPEDALAFAAKIIKEQMSVFINFDEEAEPEEATEDETNKEFNENLNRPVAELELSVRSANCLQNANIRFIGELVQKSEPEMLKTKNFGRKSLREIKDILAKMNLELGMALDSWNAPDAK